MTNSKSNLATVPIRSTEEVLESHLALRKRHDVESDIAVNYAPDVVFLTCLGIYRGHDGVRQSAQVLNEEFPNGQFEYRNCLIEGEVAFLEWTSQSPAGEVKDGADSFVVRNGEIVAQTTSTIRSSNKIRTLCKGGAAIGCPVSRTEAASSPWPVEAQTHRQCISSGRR